MNIIFFHSNGIVPTAGGISRTTANLGRIFRKKGHQVWFVGARDLHEKADYDEMQFFLPNPVVDSQHNVDYLCSFIIGHGVGVVINQSPFAAAIVNLLELCRKQSGVKVIACYHNSIITPVIRYAYQREFLLRQHGMSLFFHFLKWKPVSRLLVWGYIQKYRARFRQTIDKSDAVVLLCQGQENELLRICGYRQCDKTHVIPNCIPETKVGICEKKKQVLWVGTFDYAVKRPDFMLRIWQKVFQNHPDWMLCMLGDGPSLETMKKMAEQLKLQNVVFTGRVMPESYYEESQILCMTSVHEAFPMVPLEAMNHGLAVIAFCSFTSADVIVQDGITGLLISPFDVKAYSEKLSRLMGDDALREEMTLGSRQFIKTFSEEAVYIQWNHLFSELK